MTQYFVINRRVFPIILHLLLPIRSLWIYTLGLISIICSHWALFSALGFLHLQERESLDLKCWGLQRTHPIEEIWIHLLVSSQVPCNIKIHSKIVFLSCLLDAWSKLFTLLLNVFPFIDLVVAAFLLLTADLKIFGSHFCC